MFRQYINKKVIKEFNNNKKNKMNWYKKAQQNMKEYVGEFEDNLMKALGQGKYAPAEAEKAGMTRKKEERMKNHDGECEHSMDPHCDGSGDDGW